MEEDAPSEIPHSRGACLVDDVPRDLPASLAAVAGDLAAALAAAQDERDRAAAMTRVNEHIEVIRGKKSAPNAIYWTELQREEGKGGSSDGSSERSNVSRATARSGSVLRKF
jgi:hypothetical protein